MKPFNLTLFLLTGFLAGCPQEKNPDGQPLRTLSQREASVVRISAYTALGNLPALETELNAALDGGMSVSEIKEILIQMYAYCGFPRSLQGIKPAAQTERLIPKAKLRQPSARKANTKPEKQRCSG